MNNESKDNVTVGKITMPVEALVPPSALITCYLIKATSWARSVGYLARKSKSWLSKDPTQKYRPNTTKRILQKGRMTTSSLLSSYPDLKPTSCASILREILLHPHSTRNEVHTTDRPFETTTALFEQYIFTWDDINKAGVPKVFSRIK